MLVLTRREGEGIFIGDAYVRITRIGGASVRVAIDAPRDVPIRRDELKPFDPPASEPGDEPQRTQ